MILISPSVTFLCLAIVFGKVIEVGVPYPDGPQGPSFADQPGSLQVDLLEGGIEDHWNIEVRPAGYVNRELEQYVKDAVTQDSSTRAITIKARKVSNSQVTSGRLNTNGKWNSADLNTTKLRGYLEVRVKFPAMPNGGVYKGSWPAVWMLGTGNGGKWPGEGEIDIMEVVNGNPEIFMSLHSTHHHGGNPQHPSGQPLFANAYFCRDGAILGLEWNVQEKYGQIDITWWISYYDLLEETWKTMHTTKSLFKSHGAANDYRDFYNSFVNARGFYAIVNLAEGGDFPQCYDYSCVFIDGYPQYVVIDSAKVYGV